MLLALVWWVFGVTGTLQLGMVGVEVEDDYITRVLPDTPAERAGLRVGDRVAAIEGDEGTVGRNHRDKPFDPFHGRHARVHRQEKRPRNPP